MTIPARELIRAVQRNLRQFLLNALIALVVAVPVTEHKPVVHLHPYEPIVLPSVVSFIPAASPYLTGGPRAA